MAQSANEPDLLEHLANLVGCTYLSDLRFPAFHAALHRALEMTPPESYPDEAWREAASYLFNDSFRGSAAALRTVMLNATDD